MESRSRSFFKSDWFSVIVLVVLAAVPRLYLLFVTEQFSSDGVSYLSTALYLKDPDLIGEVPKRVYFILHPLLTLFFENFTGSIASAARIVNLMVGIAIPPLAYLLGRKFIGKTGSLAAGLFCVFNPILIQQSAEIRGDNLFALLTLVSIYIFESVDWSQHRIRDAVLLGIAIGLAQLARTNGLMYLLVVIPIWLWWLKKGKLDFKSWAVQTLIPFLLVFFVLFSIPHLLLRIRGEQLPSMFVYTFLDGNIAATSEREDIFFRLNDDATEYQILEDVSETSVTELFTDFRLLVIKYGNNFVYLLKLLFDPVIELILKMSIFLLPLAFYIFYYWGEVKVPPDIRRILFWAWPSFLILPAINIEDLYFLPLIPVLMIIIAWLFDTTSRLGWISKWQRFIFIVLMLFVLIPSLSTATKIISTQSEYTNPYLMAGNWLKENSDPDDEIMARNPEVFFHAFRRGYRMPSENLARTLQFAHHKGIDYIIFGPSEQTKRKELFLEAFEYIYRQGEDSELEFVKEIDTGTEVVYITKVIPTANNT